ncbi:MAG: transcriptional regulator [Dysgonamonadaceae bacterium]|jgi:DNA-binding HxlR family transcriptional regulator|nr:transcriptional regulator [Dysgonamonadaceae bacterium]
MLDHLEDINKAFESKARLGIMSVLTVNDEADFNTLKDWLNLTDGNLASHTRALENIGYIVAEKKFEGRKPKTSYSATTQGKKAFQAHLQALESFIKSNL